MTCYSLNPLCFYPLPVRALRFRATVAGRVEALHQTATMKTCPTCKTEKPESDFGFRDALHTRRQTVCRECNKRSAAKLRAKLTPEKQASANASKRNWKQSNPAKTKAVRILNFEIESGRLVRPLNCDKCGSHCKPEAHHDDYSKPLAVVWLCVTCHGQTRIKTFLERS